MRVVGGPAGGNTKGALALVVVFSMALSLLVFHAEPAQSQEETTGILRVKKQAKDDEQDGVVDSIFNFSSEYEGTEEDFSLMHRGSKSWTVNVGESVTVTETDLPDGWYFEDIDCESPGNAEGETEDGTAIIDNVNRTVTMTLDQAGGEFKCDFDNEMEPPDPTTGQLIVEIKSGDDPNQGFSFTSDDVDDFTLKHDEHETFDVPPGTTITVTQVLPEGWYLENINCDDENPEDHPRVGGSSSEEDLENHSVTMTLDAAGEELECSFDTEMQDNGTTTTTSAPTTTTTTTTPPPPPPPSDADTVAFQDFGGRFHFWSGATSGQVTDSFFFGNPGDLAFSGDWDCNGSETLGLYRQSDGFVYLRNSNTQGIADITFFFGNPGDVPIAGDFNNDGCDTVSIYRPSEQIFYIINRLGQNGGGLGAADYFFMFGNPGDKPFVGDFDNDGVDTIGLHRETTGRLYFRNSNSTGIADFDFIFGNPGDKMIAGDWDGDGVDTVGVYRPENGFFYIRNTHTPGFAHDDEFAGSFTGVVSISP